MANLPSAYPLIKNMRTYVSGRIDARSGLGFISNAGADPIHSIKRLNNDIPSLLVQNSRIVGAGANLYVQVSLAGSLILKDSGYSGNPLSIFQMRPPNSPEAWAYIADSLKMSKVRADGTVFQMGIAPPLIAPTATFGPDAIQIIENFSALGAWATSGTAGAISLITRFTVTTNVFYDYDTPGFSATPGVASPAQASMTFTGTTSDILPGLILNVHDSLNPDESVIIQDILPGFTAKVYSEATVRPQGAFFLHVLHLSNVTLTQHNAAYRGKMDKLPKGSVGVRAPASASSKGIQPHTLVLVGGNYIQIRSVVTGQDGSVSITLLTSSSLPLGITSISGFTTLRVNTKYFRNTGTSHTLTDKAFSFSVTIGTGNLSETAGFDLSHIQTTQNPPIDRPVQDSDVIHLSILMDHPEFFTEGKIIFDVDAVTNDFAHNYFYKAFRQNDLQQAVLSNQSILAARQARFNNSLIDSFGGRGYPIYGGRYGPAIIRGDRIDREDIGDPTAVELGPGGATPVSDQAATGASQWTELKFKVSDLARVGPDSSRSLANVAAIRIQLTVNATVAVKISDLSIRGSYGPDVGTTGAPYFYRHRGRSTLTGAKSNPSPPMLNGELPKRQSVIVTALQHPDPQVDLIDFFRWGGTLTNWLYVGTSPNNLNPQTTDVFQDLDIADAEQLEFDNFQPFPTIDTPKSGVVNARGHHVTWVSGDKFNVNWAPGAQINIGGVYYTLYEQPLDTTHLLLVENATTQPTAPYFIKQATIMGQPLPALWGPYSQASALFCFACGDSYQPGVVFLTKGNNPDSAPDVLQIEVTSPSEPMMNGCIYDGLPYAWSSQRMFILYPSFQGGFLITGGALLPSTGTNLFTPQDVKGSKGLFSRWFFCVGPKIWYGANDGIYETSGGASESITNEWLYLLFPHDGQPGQAITLGSDTIQPPDFTQPSKLRLSFSDGFLYFDYVDINGLPTTLVYDRNTRIWMLDSYALGAKGALAHYAEEGRGVHSVLVGGSDFNLYQMTGSLDNGNSFISKMKMPQDGTPSGYKHIRDCYLGLISNGLVSLVVNIDGTDTRIDLASTVGNYKEIYQVLNALKGKIFSWGVTNEFDRNPSFFSLFREDASIKMKQWGDSGPYKPINPFADVSKKARITETV